MGDQFDFEALDEGWLASKPGRKWSKPQGRLAAWIADMDFPPAPPITAALHAAVDEGDLGYTHWPYPHNASPMAQLFAQRMQQRYGWAADADHCREYADVMQAVRLVVHLMTRQGDGIVLHTPAYPPFHATWKRMHRRLIEVRAHATPTGWAYDYDELDRRLRSEPGSARIWILCHPQNPTGHVFERAELERIAQIAERHDLLVISDEIHAELVYAPRRHVPFASLGADVLARTVTLTSASKSFNVAGLCWAIAHVGSAAVRSAIDALPDHLTGYTNLMAVTAAQAAWTQGDAWLDACVSHLDRQRHRVRALLAQHLPLVEYRVPDATYLAWLDCRPLGLAEEPVEVFRRGGVELSPGPDFGAAGHGFVRLNFATSDSMVTKIVERMAGAVATR